MHSKKMKSPDEPKILILIPAYNEAQNIGGVIDEIHREVSGLPYAFDVLVVDDGSSDNTAAIASASGAEAIRLPLNGGIGVALQTGFKFAHERDYSNLIRLDADGQHPPSFISSILDPVIRREADLCIGSRFLQGKGYQASKIRRLGISWFSFLIAILFNQRITDPTSGFQAMNRRLIALYAREYASDYPEVEAVANALGNGFRVIEAPIEMKERQSGKSSIDSLHSIYYAIKVTTKVIIYLLQRH
ncbi:MAG: glycosyltransferase family 2 protein [Candidatus Abyssobacteria bacterium SURF_5]|jgi:glycosyltransferase involved in cell wall biosynthesis|uniref:Glycosyltransferase family 2 protein n=1 Tax=Abyssobacteria bacterium (strain SURF_5) TaxID=2093360 RepID=A0A3A4N7G0_ABYX5|nr:MAG: glycosyltransferase family 2 protein [Candidatus Abyssubacteria bacterium SURF_5]